MRKSFTLLLAAMLLALVACDNNGQSLSSLDENPAPAQPELLTLSVQADPAALVRSDDLQAQFLAQVVQLRVTVYNSAAQEVASKTVARDGTAVFLLPAGNYWVRMIGLDGNQNVLGYFDRLIELLQNLFNRFPGLIWTPNPPVVTIADPADPSLFLFISVPTAVTGGDPFSVTVRVYDALGNPVTSPVSNVSLVSNGLAFDAPPAAQTSDANGVVTFANLSYPDTASGTAKLTVSAPGLRSAESNPISVTAAPPPPPPMQTSIERISVDNSGLEGNGYSFDPTMSSDGRFVAFRSDATNLVANDTNGQPDIFVYDRANHTIERVSVDSAGNQGNRYSSDPAISADGRYVAFVSYADNLVANDTNGYEDVFVHDRTTGMTELVSRNSMGVQGNSNHSRPSITADGRYVAFVSSSDNLISGPSLTLYHIYLYDRSTQTIRRISQDAMGNEANGNSDYPWVTPDGRYLSFTSDASNLVPNDNNGQTDVFVCDLGNDSFERVSVDSMGNEANGRSTIPIISDDGMLVAFQSLASNLVAGDSNGVDDIFVYDRTTHTVQRVSVDASGNQADQECLQPWISGDGRFVTFDTMATNLIPNDTNGSSDIFVYDRSNGAIARVSVDGQGNEVPGWSTNSAISSDGEVIAFGSGDEFLVANDTNHDVDVFATDNPFLP